MSAGFHRHPCSIPRRTGSAHRGDDWPRQLHVHGHGGRAAAVIRDGKLIALAVSTPKRSSGPLPEVPTTLKSGFANSDYNYWMGLFVPAKTPAARIERLHAETEKALQPSERGGEIRPSGDRTAHAELRPELDALVKQEMDNNIALAKAAELKFN